jgi:lauroyl/myristoyl acyltransferase
MLYRVTLFAQELSRRLPQKVRWALGGFICQIVYWAWAEKRHNTIFNMSIILNRPMNDPLVRLAARLSWRNYGHYVGDLFDITNHPAEYYLQRLHDETDEPPAPDGTPGAFRRIDEAVAPGKGALLVTGHYGNYDVAGVIMAAHHPIHALAEKLPNPEMNEWFQSQRKQFGITIVSIDDFLRPVMRHFREGGIVATPMDRPATEEDGIPVQFFGHTTYVPRGLGALAVKMGVAIVPGFVSYAPDGTYRIRAFQPVTVTKGDDEAAAVIRATQVMFDALEAVIRDDPTQWYMFRRFWPEDAANRVPANQAARTPATARVG